MQVKHQNTVIIAVIAIAALLFWATKKTDLFRPTLITTLTHSWDTIIPNQDIPLGVPSLHAEDCGQCHQAIYQEWKLSTHAHAWTDEQYQAELAKNNDLFVCKNCHIPVQNQQKLITTGLYNGDYNKPVQVSNPHFDASLQQEGITCIACHMTDNTIIGTHPNTSAGHAVKIDTDYLSEKLCITCHDAHASLSEELVCTFETGAEWQEGPYSSAGTNCIDCHMPEIERPSAVGSISRKGHRHYFPGSGIPKVKGETAKMLNGLEFKIIKPDSILANQPILLALKVTNKNAGHKVPTGDPERFFLIQFDLLQDDQVIQSDTFRIGEKWQWYPTAKKISDNNLLPLETRIFEQTYSQHISSNLSWKVTVTKHRITPEIHTYHHLSEKYPLSIQIFQKKIRIGLY